MEIWVRNRIKELESKGDWAEAAKQWRSHGEKSEADACQLIADSVEKGNAFRASVKAQIGTEPDKETDHFKWMEWHRKLTQIK